MFVPTNLAFKKIERDLRNNMKLPHQMALNCTFKIGYQHIRPGIVSHLLFSVVVTKYDIKILKSNIQNTSISVT
jgi:hypothetical protein